jgi:Fic family protein
MELHIGNTGGLRYFEKHRDQYIERLFNISAVGDWGAWIEFCLEGTVLQAKSTADKCQRMLTIREMFMKKVNDVGGSVRLNQIVEDVFHSPFIRIADLARKLGVTYPTARTDIGRLEDAGILQRLEGVSPKTYYAPEIFNIAYEEV